MKLLAPANTPAIPLVDTNGQTVQIGQRRRMLLSLFHEANCPLCNIRVYDLSNNYPNLTHFLIEESGTVVETHGGEDTSDHIIMACIEPFAARGLASQQAVAA